MGLLVRLRLRTMWDRKKLPEECFWEEALTYLKNVDMNAVSHLLSA